MYAILASLWVNFRDVLVGLPRRCDTEIRMGWMCTRQDDVSIASVVVPERLMSTDLEI